MNPHRGIGAAPAGYQRGISTRSNAMYGSRASRDIRMWSKAAVPVLITASNGIFGADPPFEARKAHGLRPLPGAVTCTFHDGAARTVIISGVENAPEQYDAFLANADSSAAGVLKAVDGIGDKAADGVVRDISAEVVFVHGDEFVVVVCVDADKDDALFDKCKQMAAHMAA